MKTKNPKPVEILEEIFSNLITVQSISVSTEASQLEIAKKNCNDYNFDVHLVKETPESDLLLYDRKTGETRNLREKEVISESTPIADAIEYLKDQPYVFIKEKRDITRIVTKADIDSVPIRIWLFGMISLLEWQLRDYILANEILWESSLSENRIGKAKELFELKKEVNEEVRLIDCLQLIDLSSIIKKNWIHFEHIFINYSKSKSVSYFIKMTNLRNALSHSLRLDFNWKDVYEISVFVLNTLKRT